MTWYSVDPGSVHVGVCEWEGSRVLRAFELNPYEYMCLLQAIIEGRESAGFFVVEAFVVEPARATALAGSDLQVVQLIGATKLMAQVMDIDVVVQPNKILNPAKGLMRRDGWESVARGSGGHAADAERHGYYWLRSTGRQPTR